MALDFSGQIYNDPAGGSDSTVGGQIRIDHYLKKALIEARKEQFFGQLADVTSMPKHMGKTLKKYHYLPLLDDANVNDQGLDADGAAIANGNLYGSSKDVGSIPGKMPTLSEVGGRVNRVGFTRVEVTGTIQKYGFFDEYTQESVDFDTDEELRMHVNREMVNGAMEMTEDLLQIDLLDNAGTERLPGDAANASELDGSDEKQLTYADFLNLSIDLDNNRTPKTTKVFTGTRMIDTKTIAGGRVMYVGTELIPTLERMVDFHGEPAFTPVQRYAAGGTVMTGEEGSVGNFRIIVVPEMMKYAGAGASSTGTEHETGGNCDVFPLLVVGEGSFTTIGFQTDGKTVKFSIKHAAPGSTESYANDPYGETGFMSIKWYYGILIQRSERIALMKSAALL